MKKAVFLLVAMLFLIPSIDAIGIDTQNIEAQEVYLSFHPLDHYLEIIEYNLVANSKDRQEIVKTVKNLDNKIKNSEYSVSKYNFKYFKAIEEKITNEKIYIKGHYHLLTPEKNIIKLLTDVFENILRTAVKIEMTEKEIKVYFSGKGIEVADNNALGIYSRGDDRLAVWKNGVSKFDMVVSFNVEGKTSLVKYITQTIASPEKTKDEIDQLKNQSPELLGRFQEFKDSADTCRLRHMKHYGTLLLIIAIVSIVIGLVVLWLISRKTPKGAVLAIAIIIYIGGLFISSIRLREVVLLCGILKTLGFAGCLLGVVDCLRKRNTVKHKEQYNNPDADDDK